MLHIKILIFHTKHTFKSPTKKIIDKKTLEGYYIFDTKITCTYILCNEKSCEASHILPYKICLYQYLIDIIYKFP